MPCSLRALVVPILLLPFLSDEAWGAVDPRARLWTEAAAVWQSNNDVAIPADEGTRFSLVEAGAGPVLGGRVYGQVTLWDRHDLRAMWAPFTLEQEGTWDQDISFMGETFTGGTPVQTRYVFNSYRLTYRYAVLLQERTSVHVGFTGKIRDAEIALSQGDSSGSRENVGFVPLLHLAVDHRFTPDVGLLLDVDALWSPYGRAEDVALMATFRINEWARGLAGYRMVEGGADGGGNVYTFAWLHFAVLGLQVGG